MKAETYARTAALFLTIALLLGLYARHNPTVPVGHWIEVLEYCKEPRPNLVINSRVVVLQIAADGSLKINRDELDRNTYPHPLADIFETRSEKNLYVMASPELAYQEFMSDISKAQGSVRDLRVFVLLPSDTTNQCSVVPPAPPSR